MDKKYECHNCGTKIGLNGGLNGATIYVCEKECGNFICSDCILKSDKYEEELTTQIDGISGLEDIECLECK